MTALYSASSIRYFPFHTHATWPQTCPKLNLRFFSLPPLPPSLSSFSAHNPPYPCHLATKSVSRLHRKTLACPPTSLPSPQGPRTEDGKTSLYFVAAPCRTIDVCLRVPCSTRPIDQLPPLPQLERKPIPAKQRKKWFPILPHAFDLAYFETVLNLLYGILEGGVFFFSLSFCIASPVPFTCHVCSTSYNSLPSLVPSKLKTNKPCICTLSPTQPLLDSVGVKACIYRLTLTLSHSHSLSLSFTLCWIRNG